MRATKIIIIAVGLLFCSSICNAQIDYGTPSQQIVGHKKQIKMTPYIFEGNVILQKSYNGKHQIIGTSIIQIAKIYKGSPELKLGSIKVVTGQQDYRKDGDLIILSVPSDGGGLGIYKDSTYIFFCSNADASSLVDSTVTDNTSTLTLAADPVVFQGKGAQWDITLYTTIDSLYSFFKENGLTVQQEVQKQ